MTNLIYQNDKAYEPVLIYQNESLPGIEKIQLYGKNLNGVTYQDYEPLKFNYTQYRMYYSLLNGLKFYKPEIVAKFSQAKKDHITRKHKKTQQVINRWKNQIVNAYSNHIFKSIFWNSDIAKEMVALTEQDDTALNTMTFRELGLQKHQIAQKLIEHKLLPDNFFLLTA